MQDKGEKVSPQKQPTNKQCPKCGSYNTYNGNVLIGAIGGAFILIGIILLPLLVIGLVIVAIAIINEIYERIRGGKKTYACKGCNKSWRE